LTKKLLFGNLALHKTFQLNAHCPLNQVHVNARISIHREEKGKTLKSQEHRTLLHRVMDSLFHPFLKISDCMPNTLNLTKRKHERTLR